MVLKSTHKRILVNLSYVSKKPTGLSNYASGIIPYLNKLEPIFLSAQEISGQNNFLVSDTMTSLSGKKGHFNRLLWTQFSLPQIYEKLKAELIFSPIPEAPLYSKCKYIVTVHDLIPLRFPKYFSPFLYQYFKQYIPRIVNQAEHIICNSQTTANDIVDFFKVSSSKVSPILLGYDSQKFRLIKNLPPVHTKYFLYIGRYDNHKNLDRLVDAFASLKTDVELWFAGSVCGNQTALNTKVKELNITPRVKFLNYVTDNQLPILISQAICLVFPSLWEGFGLPIIEAMACGTPVITSNCSSLKEVAGDAALLINPYNTSELADNMAQVLNNSNLAQSLTQKGLERVKEFSWKKTGTQTVEVLKRFL